MSTEFSFTIPAHFAKQLRPLHPEGAQHAAAAALRLYLDLGELGVKALLARAKHEDMTPAELIENLLSYVPTQGAGTITGSAQPASQSQPSKIRREDNSARDAAIADEYLAGGITYAALAAKWGLSMVRVTQIVARARAMRGLA